MVKRYIRSTPQRPVVPLVIMEREACRCEVCEFARAMALRRLLWRAWWGCRRGRR